MKMSDLNEQFLLPEQVLWLGEFENLTQRAVMQIVCSFYNYSCIYRMEDGVSFSLMKFINNSYTKHENDDSEIAEKKQNWGVVEELRNKSKEGMLEFERDNLDKLIQKDLRNISHHSMDINTLAKNLPKTKLCASHDCIDKHFDLTALGLKNQKYTRLNNLGVAPIEFIKLSLKDLKKQDSTNALVRVFNANELKEIERKIINTASKSNQHLSLKRIVGNIFNLQRQHTTSRSYSGSIDGSTSSGINSAEKNLQNKIDSYIGPGQAEKSPGSLPASNVPFTYLTPHSWSFSLTGYNFSDIGLNFSVEDYKNAYFSIAYPNVFVTNHTQTKKVLSSALPIAKKWSKMLQSLNITHDISICGGSLRDVVLGREVRDVDVFLRIPTLDCVQIDNLVARIVALKADPADLDKLAFWGDNGGKKIAALCALMSKYIMKDDTLFNNLLASDVQKDGTEYDWIDLIEAVVKYPQSKIGNKTSSQDNGDGELFDIDLIITPYSLTMQEFVDEFDCNLSKIRMDLVSYRKKYSSYNSKSSLSEGEEVDVEDFLKPGYWEVDEFFNKYMTKNTYINAEFYADSYNKTATFNFSKANCSQSTIDSHLPRVFEKYSDYKFNLVCPFGSSSQIENKSKAQAVLESLMIQKQISNGVGASFVKKNFKI